MMILTNMWKRFSINSCKLSEGFGFQEADDDEEENNRK